MGRKREKLINLVVDRYVNLELFARQQRELPNGCIEWTGVQNNIGYGFIGFRKINPDTGETLKGPGGMMTTHRLAWMVEHNRLPTKRNINHTCHNKLCMNPVHLQEGTQRDKLDAMVRDGITGKRGPGTYNHKQENRTYNYSEEEIQWIRTADTLDIAAKYGIDRVRASAKRCAFRKGYTWLPIPDVAYPKAKVGRKKTKC